MGFFSWDCKGCGFSIREGAGWMGQAVAQGTRNRSRVDGFYDGYGRIDGANVMDLFEKPEVWHSRCYELSGCPKPCGPSRMSLDQGTPNCDRREPEDYEEMQELQSVSERERESELAERCKWVEDSHRSS